MIVPDPVKYSKPRRHPGWRLLLSLSLLLSVAGPWARPVAAATVPAGFIDVSVTNVFQPTSLAFTPDGRMLVTSEPGRLFVYANGALIATPALDLSAIICTNYERGLLGLAVDPNFAANNYIYLFYTFNRNSICSTQAATDPVNRVSRFVLPNTNVVNPASELVLVDNMPSTGGFHNSGDLQFGADGLLYISAGDGTKASNARLKSNLGGKILRVQTDGTAPADNPFVSDPGSRRCGDPAGSSGTTSCQEIFAFGLRNPFRFAFRPGTNEFFINDVGQDTWEEISLGQKGADYGWACREGAHPFDTTSSRCVPPPPNMVDPIFEYQHGFKPGSSIPEPCNAVTGGAFVPTGLWPGYDGAYLFADYVCGRIFTLRANGGGYTIGDFASGIEGPVHLMFGPHAGTQALYYLDRNNSKVRRVVYANMPVAALTATPTFGLTPLNVTFNATGSTGPGTLSYDWDFGDGAPPITGTSSISITHVYVNPAPAVYTATLTVRSSLGLASAPEQVQIFAGDRPPAPVISSPVPGAQFAAGAPISLSGSATDPDSPPSAVRLRWDVLLHHVDQLLPGSEHTHPLFSTNPITTSTGALSGTLPMPAPESLRAAALSYVEVQLTAIDPLGLSTTVTRTVDPRRIALTFATQPNGLSLVINGEVITASQSFISWQDYALSLEAPPLQLQGLGNYWGFLGWSNGGARTQTLVTPGVTTTYTATYQLVSVNWLPLLHR